MLTPREEARAYRIWAVGKSVKWDCTLREIADETGLDLRVVQRLCKAKGWNASGQYANGGTLRSQRSGVDQIMASADCRQYEGKT